MFENVPINWRILCDHLNGCESSNLKLCPICDKLGDTTSSCDKKKCHGIPEIFISLDKYHNRYTFDEFVRKDINDIEDIIFKKRWDFSSDELIWLAHENDLSIKGLLKKIRYGFYTK